MAYMYVTRELRLWGIMNQATDSVKLAGVESIRNVLLHGTVFPRNRKHLNRKNSLMQARKSKR